ncbi:anti-sigma-F factor Fin family protein [Bacillus sp. 31A1R]|uniref:Anti-sigma-F factor Fin family protein n=1 Tax=Robertmurraya mangrovi TaxID=3098077 RepID=A0ABU5J4J6_9BACI|nr:anti-sigma-F factor Fin family protein [Bacillus sp. 31A1R]MDZ5474327.1 anti-sigma-F factor Fin family protein [Bacillus sp. 31A1R]
MAINYQCRHCGVNMGTIDHLSVHSHQLGINMLTDEERLDMVDYDQSGNIKVKSICEDCQESYQRNPDLHQYDYLIH